MRDDLSGDYVQVDGTIKIGPGAGPVTGTTPPKNNPARTMDVYIKLNRPLDGTIFVYDNLGVGVRQLDLSDLIKLWPAGSEDVQREIKISWNGTDYRNKFVGRRGLSDAGLREVSQQERQAGFQESAVEVRMDPGERRQVAGTGNSRK